MIEEQIKETIKKDINPGLEMHNGGCEFIKLEKGKLTVRLYGGCRGCPSSQMTLLNGIAPVLKDKFSEVKEVVMG